MTKVLLFIVSIVLSGCAASQIDLSQIDLIVDSKPKGAKIFQGSEYVGEAPVLFYHHVTKEDQEKGYFYMRPMYARWLSGAEYHSKGMQVFLKDGQTQNLYFQRPLNASNEIVDLNYGLELEKLSAMQDQAEYTRRQAALMYLNMQP